MFAPIKALIGMRSSPKVIPNGRVATGQTKTDAKPSKVASIRLMSDRQDTSKSYWREPIDTDAAPVVLPLSPEQKAAVKYFKSFVQNRGLPLSRARDGHFIHIATEVAWASWTEAEISLRLRIVAPLQMLAEAAESKIASVVRVHAAEISRLKDEAEQLRLYAQKVRPIVENNTQAYIDRRDDRIADLETLLAQHQASSEQMILQNEALSRDNAALMQSNASLTQSAQTTILPALSPDVSSSIPEKSAKQVALPEQVSSSSGTTDSPAVIEHSKEDQLPVRPRDAGIEQDLSVIVRKLAVALNRIDNNHQLPHRAVDYLMRKELLARAPDLTPPTDA